MGTEKDITTYEIVETIKMLEMKIKNSNSEANNSKIPRNEATYVKSSALKGKPVLNLICFFNNLWWIKAKETSF